MKYWGKSNKLKKNWTVNRKQDKKARMVNCHLRNRQNCLRRPGALLKNVEHAPGPHKTFYLLFFHCELKKATYERIERQDPDDIY
jgi:hypothetical protein